MMYKILRCGIALILIWLWSIDQLVSQVHLDLPRIYQKPYQHVALDIQNDKIEGTPWTVQIDSPGIMGSVSSNSNLVIEFNYGQAYYVYQEDNTQLLIGTFDGSLKGWVNKEDLLLWSSSLIDPETGQAILAVNKAALPSPLLSRLVYPESIRQAKNQDIYRVFKIKGNQILISSNSIRTEMMAWVPIDDFIFIQNRWGLKIKKDSISIVEQGERFLGGYPLISNISSISEVLTNQPSSLGVISHKIDSVVNLSSMAVLLSDSEIGGIKERLRKIIDLNSEKVLAKELDPDNQSQNQLFQRAYQTNILNLNNGLEAQSDGIQLWQLECVNGNSLQSLKDFFSDVLTDLNSLNNAKPDYSSLDIEYYWIPWLIFRAGQLNGVLSSSDVCNPLPGDSMHIFYLETPNKDYAKAYKDAFNKSFDSLKTVIRNPSFLFIYNCPNVERYGLCFGISENEDKTELFDYISEGSPPALTETTVLSLKNILRETLFYQANLTDRIKHISLHLMVNPSFYGASLSELRMPYRYGKERILIDLVKEINNHLNLEELNIHFYTTLRTGIDEEFYKRRHPSARMIPVKLARK